MLGRRVHRKDLRGGKGKRYWLVAYLRSVWLIAHPEMLIVLPMCLHWKRLCSTFSLQIEVMEAIRPFGSLGCVDLRGGGSCRPLSWS